MACGISDPTEFGFGRQVDLFSPLNDECDQIDPPLLTALTVVLMMMRMVIVMIKTHHHPSLSSPPSLQEVFRPCPFCFAVASSSSSPAGFETRPADDDDD